MLCYFVFSEVTVRTRYPDESGYRIGNLAYNRIFDIRTNKYGGHIRYPDIRYPDIRSGYRSF
jgi:hypothetical protein